MLYFVFFFIKSIIILLLLISVGRRGVYAISVHRSVGCLGLSPTSKFHIILFRWEYYFVTMTIIRANQLWRHAWLLFIKEIILIDGEYEHFRMAWQKDCDCYLFSFTTVKFSWYWIYYAALLLLRMRFFCNLSECANVIFFYLLWTNRNKKNNNNKTE